MPTSTETLEALRAHFPVCSAAAGPELPRLAELLTPEEFVSGAVILSEGDISGRLYLIVSGAVEVSILLEGARQRVTTLGPGQWFGEVGFFTGGLATATVMSNTPARCLMLSRKQMLAAVEAEPAVASAILAQLTPTLTHRLRTTRQVVGDEFSLDPARSTPRGPSFLRVLQTLFGAK